MSNTNTPWQAMETLEARLLLSVSLVEWTAGGGGDYYGNTQQTATPVVLDSTGGAVVKGAIQTAKDADFLKVVAANTGEMKVGMRTYETTPTLDSQVTVYNSSGSMLGFNDNVDSAYNAMTSVSVVKGSTYYVKAASSNETAGKYLLSIVNPAPVANSAPVFNAISDKTVAEGGSLSFTVGATDANKDPLVYSVESLPQGAKFDGGKFTWTPTYEQAGGYDVVFDVTDMKTTTSKKVHIDVTNKNRKPTLQAVGTVTAEAGRLFTLQLQAADPDGDAITYKSANLPAGSTLNAQTGLFSWTPTTAQIGSYSNLKFYATDGSLTATRYATINVVAAVNKAPVLAPIGNKAVTAGQNLSFTVSATDPDGDSLTYSATGLPQGATFDAATRKFSWTPTASQVGSYSGLKFNVTDGKLSASETIGVTVNTTTGGGSGGTSSDITSRNVKMIDADGDGYGVNSTKGPDADDNDAAVNTYNSALAKYGSLQGILNHLGYNPSRIYTSMPSTKLQPGDAVVLAGGTYGNINIQSTNGTASAPILIMARPGEKVTLTGSSNAILIENSSYVTFDGLNLDGKGGSGIGAQMHYSNNVTYRNMNAYGWLVGMQSAQDLRNILIEKSAWHDSTGSHGVYLAARGYPNSNITVRDNLFFNNKNGFQHNGRVTNLVMERNIMHSNWLAGVSWLEGVSNSFIRGNLIFNNGTQGIVVSNYDDAPDSDIYPYNQTNNTIEDNIIWVGQYSDGQYQPANQQAIAFTDSTARGGYLINGTIRNNTIVTHNGATFRFAAGANGKDTTITGNKIYRTGGTGLIMEAGSNTYNWSGFQGYSSTFSNNTFADPKFADVSTSYYAAPEKFNFSTGTSGGGTTNTAPVLGTIGSKTVTAGQPISFTVSATDAQNDPLTYTVQGLPTGATFDATTRKFTWTPTSAQAGVWGMKWTVSDGRLTDEESMAITVNAPTSGGGGGGGTVTGVGASADVLNRERSFIDKDGDGYGVNSSKGPDADDSDASVNTYTSMINKYGTVQNFVKTGLGYNPKRIYIGEPSTALQPGDMVIIDTNLSGNYTMGASNVHGTASDPIIYLAMPGKNITITALNDAIDLDHDSYMVWDGFNLDGSQASYGLGINMSYSQNMTFKNLNVHGWNVGMQAAQDLHNIEITNSVFHDQDGSHGLYLAARSYPNSNLWVHDNLFFNNKNGMQHNGRVTNLRVENNVIYNNWLAGISWLEGVHDSAIRNNLIFNNGTQGIVVNNYDDTPGFDIYPYDQVNNVIENNTIWVGQYNGNLTGDGAGYSPADQQAIAFTDATSAQAYTLNATIRNNVLVTYNGSTFRFEPSKNAKTSTITDNLIYRYNGSGNILTTGGQTYNWSGFQSYSSTYTGNTLASTSPFVDVLTSYYANPDRFNFNLA